MLAGGQSVLVDTNLLSFSLVLVLADHMRRHRVRWLGHAARKPNDVDVMVKQLLFAHSIPGHSRPMGRSHLTWMDTAMTWAA